jgi:hypothetical protein
MRSALAALVTLSVLVACGSDEAPASPSSDGGSTATDGGGGVSDASSNDGATAADGDADGGIDASDATPCTPPSTPPRILFLNKNGGTYTPELDDSRTNKSSIVNQQTSITAWSVAAPTWTGIVDCVKQKLAPFNVTVTDADPGATAAHVEVVFAQNDPSIFNGAPSVAPSSCSIKENAVCYVSQAHAEANATNGCAAAAQVYGFVMGLEFVSTCPDAMAFDYAACATASFSKTPLACGTTEAASCTCGAGTTQTSFDKMLAVLGPRCL